jgi:tRNA threonylcarbamoyladenosine biosynthesis protein TsaB
MDNFHILAFETSGNQCSVALLSQIDGRVSLRAAQHAGRQDHAERILPLAQSLLDQANLARAQLSAVAFGQGPGGFTGLRVACGVAQGLAVALDIPVLPVDSLCAIAMQQASENPTGVHLVMQDARMNELYVAAYQWQAPDWLTLQAPALIARADVAAWMGDESAIWAMQAGGGWTVHGDALAVFPGLAEESRQLGAQVAPDAVSDQVWAHASTIARLAARAWQAGQGLDASMAAPAYVRDKVAYTTQERTRGLGGNPATDATQWSVHDMSLSDVDEVASIERHVQSFPWTKQNFLDGLQAGYRGWVVRRLGAMLGFALVMDTPDMAHLLVIGVRPDGQRRGVGTELLRYCLAHCRQAGLPALTLEVRPSNTSAIGFYQKHGFQQVGLRRGYYPADHGVREDAWIMTLTCQETSA